ncbi:MAG: ribose ABC transporter permease [Verrucomicrobiae bacterium]|nr:ribose ABC transporter permease [Verrucomicrobiae bacterium]
MKLPIRRVGLVIALLLIGTTLSVITSTFLTLPNLLNIARQVSINGILAVGVTYVLLTGGVDLSLGSVVALSGVIAASFAHPGDWPGFVPVTLGILTGAICGTTNGFLVAVGKVPPFIATLGMMTATRGLALVVSSGKPVSNLSAEFKALGTGMAPVTIFITVAMLSWLLLGNLRLGRHIYAVGGNENAARAAGINVDRVKLFAYTFCGALAGLAGVVLAARITTGQPNAAVGYELDAIAAVVIGGTSLSGGTGSIPGTLLGTILMGVINNGLDLLNVSSYYQAIVKGVIIVGAVWLDQHKEKL